MEVTNYLSFFVFFLTMHFQHCSTEDNNSPSQNADEWKQLYNDDILELRGNESEPIKCSKIGRGASKLNWLLDLSSQNATVEFYLSTKKRLQFSKITTEDLYERKIIKSYNPKRTTYVIVHGWLSNANETWVDNMKNALLNWDDANVIAVDWSSGGNTLKYWKAVRTIESAGNSIAIFINQLMNITKTNQKNFHFIGHSLGAHISSYAAVKLGNVRRITGLDPAHTCTITTNKDYLLDKSDAKFVDVIHTSATMLIKFGFGTRSAIGHVDFYPNGGEKQPKCYERKRSPFSKLIPFYRGITAGICNHGRAYDLFIESLQNNGCPLVGHSWERTIKSVSTSLSTPCTLKNCSVMGIYADRSPARGVFYVTTRGQHQYCEKIKVFYNKVISDDNTFSSYYK